MSTNSSFRSRYEQVLTTMARLSDELPGPMAGFGQLHATSTAPGALDAKTKELVALGIAISVRCDGCIAFHVHDALEAGAAREEVIETIGVAVMMGGGPSVVYGTDALRALDEFTAEMAVS